MQTNKKSLVLVLLEKKCLKYISEGKNLKYSSKSLSTRTKEISTAA